MQKLKAERDSLLDRLARAQANSKMRAAAPPKSSRTFATTPRPTRSRLCCRSSTASSAPCRSKSEPGDFRSGVELIYKQLQDALAKLGVRAIPAKGEPFDPHVHEAIEMVETTDAPDHEVLEELQRGYKFKDRLLRPAMVKVAKNP